MWIASGARRIVCFMARSLCALSPHRDARSDIIVLWHEWWELCACANKSERKKTSGKVLLNPPSKRQHRKVGREGNETHSEMFLSLSSSRLREYFSSHSHLLFHSRCCWCFSCFNPYQDFLFIKLDKLFWNIPPRAVEKFSFFVFLLQEKFCSRNFA